MNDNAFKMMSVDGAYVKALVELVNACQMMEVEINKVHLYQNGWHVTFKGYEGADAICHDGSYGSPYPWYESEAQHANDWTRKSMWETIGFPWDGDDVSTHSAKELAFYLHALNEGKSVWKKNEDC